MDITLVNYRHAASQPLRSITQLPRQEAFAVAAALYNASPCAAHRRFGPDFASYYAYRLQIEAELYSQFVALGGQPRVRHPYYFVVEYCDSLRRNFADCTQTSLPLSAIDPRHVSFTFGDSMAQHEKGMLRPLFLVDALHRHIAAHGGIAAFLRDIADEYKCIEAQVWAGEYFAGDG